MIRYEDDLELHRHIRSGDTVAWPQGAGEPRVLSRALVEQRHQWSDLRVFVGTLLGDTLTPGQFDGLGVLGFGGLGTGSAIAREGLMDVMPIRVSAVKRLVDNGSLPIDVALVQLAGPDESGRYSTGCTSDYVRSLMRAARVVIAEVNSQTPFTLGEGALVHADEVDVFVKTDYAPWVMPPTIPEPGSETDVVARRVAELIPDRATLQTGIGSIIDALPRHLSTKKDLGIHAGMINDGTLNLIEAGVVTNRCKEIDPDVTVTGALFGTNRLYAWANKNARLSMRDTDYTHGAATLGRLESFWAVNGALDIDLSGQVNSEMIGTRHFGAIGGQLDFANAAAASVNGRSIVALTSTAKGGAISRIRPSLSGGIVSTPRADVDLVVTEYGVADLRAATISQRAERLIAIAHPDHRAQLEASFN